MTTPYNTQFKGGSWSVSVHEHGAGSFNYDPKHVASYEASQGSLGETGRSAMEGYVTMGGANPEMKSRGGNATATAHDSGPNQGRRATVRMHTPEGHELSTEHVQGIMSGTHDPQALREHYADEHEVGKQHAFEDTVRRHIARHGDLPHSGVDALVAGVPTRDSSAGLAISSGIVRGGSNGGTYHTGQGMPHYSGDTSLENPSDAVSRKRSAAYESQVASGVPKDRAGHPGRIVDHR